MMAAANADNEDLKADIEELKRLLAESQRPRVKRLLEKELQEIEKVCYLCAQLQMLPL